MVRPRAWVRSIVLWSIVALLGALLVYPIWLTVRGGFQSATGDGWTLHHVLSVFTTPRLREGLSNSLLIALVTTTLSLLLALPLALASVRLEFPGKRALAAMILVPLILPPFVGAIGMQHLLGRSGSLNALLLDLGLVDSAIDFTAQGGFWAVVILEALHLYPILYLNVAASLARVDPALEEAAENLGASRWRRFRTIILPLIRPGLFAGGTIVFIWSFTELGTPLMFEFHQVTPVQIANGIREMDARAEPYALTVVMLTIALALYVLGRHVLGRGAHVMLAKGAPAALTRRPKPIVAALVAAMFVVITLIASLPHVGVILASISETGAWYRSLLPREFTLLHFEHALSHDLATASIRNSLLYAGAAVLIDLGLGVMIAYLVVRTRTRGRGVLDALAMLPLAVPGLVMAFGYVAMTLTWPFAGRMPAWLRAITESWMPRALLNWLDAAPLAGVADVLGAMPNPAWLLIVAYAIRRLPYVVRAAAAGLEQTPRELEEASLNLGAGQARTLGRITLPLIAPHLIAGGLLAFSFAMLEVSDSLILAQREQHFPITKAIYVLFQRLGDGQAIASAMGVWAMALLALTLLTASLLMGRRIAATVRP